MNTPLFILNLLMTVVALVATVIAGRSAKRPLHYGLAVSTIFLLGAAIYQAEMYGRDFQFDPIRLNVHLTCAVLALLTLPGLVSTGLSLARGRENSRVWHKKWVLAFVVLTVLAIATALWMFVTAGPLTQEEASAAPTETLILGQPDLPSWAQDNLRRRDPAQDAWRTEVLQAKASTSLKSILASWQEGRPSPSELWSATFRGASKLRPEALETIRSGPRLTVRLGQPVAALELKIPQAVVDSWQTWIAALGATGELKVRTKMVAVAALPQGHFSTHVLVFVARDGAQPSQSDAEWDLVWQVHGEEEEAQLVELRVTRYTEVFAGGRFFEDVTETIMSPIAAWQEEYLRGVGDYQWRTDRLMGSSFLGAQGLAVGDANGDGFEDLYLCQQGGIPNRLLLRGPKGGLVDATETTGLGFLDNTRSALFLDLDNDGDQDLVMATGPNLLIAWNAGGAAFSEFTPVAGEGKEEIYSLAAADVDGDSDLDLYAARYVLDGLMGGLPVPYHDANNGAANLFWRNEGEHQFVLATGEHGLDHNNRKFSLAVLFEDLDADGDPDLYVSNDFGRNNFYVNDGSGHFQDRAELWQAEDLAAGMGVTSADFDGDGRLDLYISNMFSSAGRRIVPQSERFMEGENAHVHQHYRRHARGNTLLLNQGTRFRDATDGAGVAVGGWAWGALALDFDNDGRSDLFSPDGFVTNRDPEDL